MRSIFLVCINNNCYSHIKTSYTKKDQVTPKKKKTNINRHVRLKLSTKKKN